ncbi:WD40/YVTN/BNR-like repeat-containing protein [Patescibacteria group bacterium]
MFNKKCSFLLLITISLVFFTSGCVQLSKKIDYGGVFKSIDSGNSLTQSSIIATTKQVDPSIGLLNIYNMVSDPQDNKAIYALSNGLYYSYDRAMSWHIAQDLYGKRISALVVSNTNKCHIYASTANKIFFSNDCNRTFKEIYSDPRTSIKINKINIDVKNPSLIFAGTSKGDLLRSNDGGISWANIKNFKYSIKDIFIEKENSNTLYIATDRKFYKTIDGGNEWIELTKNIEKITRKSGKLYLKKIIYTNDGEKKNITLLTKKDIIFSSNGGDTWDRLNLITPQGKVELFSIAINPLNPKEIYYGTSKALVKSIDGGATWTSNKLPSTRLPYCLLIDPINTNTLYMGMYKLEE